MVRHCRIELLMHPLTQKYLAMKWQAYGRICHMLSMLLYAVFVALVTAHGVHLLQLVRRCPALLHADGYVNWEELDDGGQRACDQTAEVGFIPTVSLPSGLREYHGFNFDGWRFLKQAVYLF